MLLNWILNMQCKQMINIHVNLNDISINKKPIIKT